MPRQVAVDCRENAKEGQRGPLFQRDQEVGKDSAGAGYKEVESLGTVLHSMTALHVSLIMLN